MDASPIYAANRKLVTAGGQGRCQNLPERIPPLCPDSFSKRENRSDLCSIVRKFLNDLTDAAPIFSKGSDFVSSFCLPIQPLTDGTTGAGERERKSPRECRQLPEGCEIDAPVTEYGMRKVVVSILHRTDTFLASSLWIYVRTRSVEKGLR